MRRTFSEICLFNDDQFQRDTSFIFTGKERVIDSGRERTREEECVRLSVGEKGCSVDHKPWSSFYEGLQNG
jgi:hypothetical protein